MLKTTQRYPIVGISVYQLRGREPLSIRRESAAAVSHVAPALSGMMILQKSSNVLENNWTHCQPLAIMFWLLFFSFFFFLGGAVGGGGGGVLISKVFVCSQLERDDI